MRLGFDTPPPADLAGLGALHRAHLRTFPFENLDIHLGRPIRLDGDSIIGKLLDQRRGGYCYELNSGFASLLASVGFDVSILEARVYRGDDVGIRFAHACLRVGLGGGRLADVGFGACFQDSIALRPDVDQEDPSGIYRLAERHDGWLDLCENGQRRYRLSPTPRSLAEFAEANRYHQTSPFSRFTQGTVCSVATERGRITVQGLRLIETIGGDRIETDLRPGQLGSVLAGRFGIHLANADLDRLGDA